MATLLITGASGTLGKVLRAHFARAGDIELRLLDRDDGGDPAIARVDLATEPSAWASLLEGVDVVLHLAANASPAATWPELIGPNVDAVLNLYHAAAARRVPHIVLASSIWAAAARRGNAGPIHANEGDAGDSPYGASKLVAERIAHAAWQSDGIAGTILRIGAYSPGGSARGLQRGWDAEARLSPRDLCAGVERAVRRRPQGVRTLNLISGNARARFTLDEAEAAIGYVAQDHHPAPSAIPWLRTMIRRFRSG